MIIIILLLAAILFFFGPVFYILAVETLDTWKNVFDDVRERRGKR